MLNEHHTIYELVGHIGLIIMFLSVTIMYFSKTTPRHGLRYFMFGGILSFAFIFDFFYVIQKNDEMIEKLKMVNPSHPKCYQNVEKIVLEETNMNSKIFTKKDFLETQKNINLCMSKDSDLREYQYINEFLTEYKDTKCSKSIKKYLKDNSSNGIVSRGNFLDIKSKIRNCLNQVSTEDLEKKKDVFRKNIGIK